MTVTKKPTKRAIPKILEHLKPKQAQFVLNYLRHPTIKEAAADTGVSERTGQRYMTVPEVRAAILDALDQQRAKWAVIGFNTLADLAENADTDAARISAAKELIQRGIGPVKEVKEHKHTYGLEKSTAEKLERIAELQRELGMGGKVVEGEFKEVKAEDAEAEKPVGKLLEKLPFQIA